MMLFAGLTLAAPLALDPATSKLGFTVGSSLDEVRGVARTLTGRFDPTTRTGSLEVAVAGLDTGLGPRDARLLSYALELPRFPAIQFVLTDAPGLLAEGAGDTLLRGRLTIRDVTRPVDLPVHYGWEGSALRLGGRVDLAWADYGVPDPSVLVATVAPTVGVSFDVVLRAPEVTPETH